jgi:hypothetical protein
MKADVTLPHKSNGRSLQLGAAQLQPVLKVDGKGVCSGLSFL